jgi:serine/threonine-protein kinase
MSRLENFVANAARSGLILPLDLARARARVNPQPAADADVRLARLLIEQGALTGYQANKLLGGATRGFFLGAYRILRPLGEGGMGKVFLATRDRDGQEVAVKVLPPRRALQEEQALLRFQREMELSQRVHHPNLARTMEVGREEDIYYMVMEYIPGVSLYEMVKGQGGGPLRVPDTARVFLKVLDGLTAAHAAGLVHRDIKPSNIMITPEGEPKILDLGLARALGGNEGTESEWELEAEAEARANVVVGTLDYASPEQLGNAASADHRSDLYSIGCTLYFTLAGRPPFEGGDVVNKIFKQRMEDPEPLERVARGVPAAFAAIVRKLMAKKPDDRYQSGTALRAELARWTDPAKVRAILGAEAETARAFRLPSSRGAGDDDDLPLNRDDDGSSPLSFSLHDLVAADPEAARSRDPSVPTSAASPLRRRKQTTLPFLPRYRSNDTQWLFHFIAIAVILGVLAILAITLLR